MNLKRIISGLIGFPIVVLIFLLGNKYVIDVALAIVAVIGMLSIGYYGWSALSKTKSDMDNMYQKSVKGLEYIGNIRYGMRYAQGMTVIMTTVKNDPQRMTDLEKKYQAGADEIDANLAEYEKLVADDKEKEFESQAKKSKQSKQEDEAGNNYYLIIIYRCL